MATWASINAKKIFAYGIKTALKKISFPVGNLNLKFKLANPQYTAINLLLAQI